MLVDELKRRLAILENGGLVPEVPAPPDHLALASEALGRGEHDATFAHLDAARVARVSERRLLPVLTRALTAVGRHDEALECFELLCILGAPQGRSFYEVAEAFEAAGLAELAERGFRAAITASPKLTDAHLRLGMLCLEQRRLGEAIALLGQAVALDPHAAVARYYLAQACLQAKEYSRAHSQLHFLRKLSPDYAPGYVLAAEVAERQGDWRQVASELRQLVVRKGADAEAYYRLGRASWQIRDDATAERYLAKALELDPSRGEAMFYLGQLYERQGQLERALQVFRTLAEQPRYASWARRGAERVERAIGLQVAV